MPSIRCYNCDVGIHANSLFRDFNRPRPSEKLHHGLVNVKDARTQARHGPDRHQSFHSGCIIGVQPAVGEKPCYYRHILSQSPITVRFTSEPMFWTCYHFRCLTKNTSVMLKGCLHSPSNQQSFGFLQHGNIDDWSEVLRRHWPFRPLFLLLLLGGFHVLCRIHQEGQGLLAADGAIWGDCVVGQGKLHLATSTKKSRF